MKKVRSLLIPIIALAIAGCNNSTPVSAFNGKTNVATSSSTKKYGMGTIVNGGFESGTLSGWTVEYGTAYNDDSVSSVKTFTFDYDSDHKEIKVQQEGNWYLSGKGFEGTFSHGRIGAIRSTNFYLGGDGSIAMKLAGGALRRGKGSGAASKGDINICYVGVYRASDDRMIAMQRNDFFLEHTEPYVDVRKYNSGVYNTDNFAEYELDLSEYKGQELYIRIVDNDTDVYYGYLSVDDIRIGGEDSQQPGDYYVKTRDYQVEATAPSEFEIANGDFECGSLAGWTVTEGLAFSNQGVNREETWWNENIPYQREGNYHYGYYKPSATGKMQSSRFKLGGSGWISFRLGGCRENHLTYISVYLVNQDDTVTEIARYSHRTYWDFQFPYVPNGMRLLNLIQYVADLHEYIGSTLYLELVDNNTSPDDLACMTIDSIVTYYPTKPTFYNQDYFEAHSMISVDPEFESEYQVPNGSFEEGTLNHWTLNGEEFGEVTNAIGWWTENFPYNKKGTYLFSGIYSENKTGYIQSEKFTVGGIGKMSFLFGGGKDPRLCYISLYSGDTEVARYSNRYFHDLGTGLLNNGSNLANMVQYVADISEFKNQELYIRVYDNAVNNWGLVTVDGFVTYYTDENSLPNSYYEAVNMLKVTQPEQSENQIRNGGFETGDLTGWELTGNMGTIAYDDVWWNEWYDYNKSGTYFFSGMAEYEGNMGTLTSEAFVVDGSNKISFKLGGGKEKEKCYVEIIDATTNESLMKFSNYKFNDFGGRSYYYNGRPIDLSRDGVYLANMVQYVADLSELAGRSVKIRVVDNAPDNWGLITVDDFVTYYETDSDVISGYAAMY